MTIALGMKEPAASDSVHDHADWIELAALCAADGNASFQDFVSVIRRAGTVDALDERSTADRGSELTQQLADSAFSELSNRTTGCTGSKYPFDLSDQLLQLRVDDPYSDPYIFMLLLKTVGVKFDPDANKPASLFEEVAAVASKSYLGGEAAGAKTFHFGFPRRTQPSGFRAALDQLCVAIREGGGSKDGPTVADQKDAKLDIVAWKPFPDGRVGRIIAFGQCAAGGNYADKVLELSPRQFYQRWMIDRLRTEPLVFFFVPRCLKDDELDHFSSAGSIIIFDRCRIAANIDASEFDSDHVAGRSNWVKAAIEQNLRAA